MIKYKLTTQQGTTHNGYQWSLPKGKRPGKWHKTDGRGELCGPGWLHYYHDPMLAVLLNPIHANIKDPILWEVEVDGEQLDDNGLKGGTTKMRLVRRIELPTFSTVQRTAFGILCALEVCKEKSFVAWANKWLSGNDRSAAAARATEAAAAWAERAAEAAAVWAREAATWATEAAAAWAAEAAAARAAEAAAAWEARAAQIDLVTIAKKAQQVQ